MADTELESVRHRIADVRRGFTGPDPVADQSMDVVTQAAATYAELLVNLPAGEQREDAIGRHLESLAAALGALSAT